MKITQTRRQALQTLGMGAALTGWMTSAARAQPPSSSRIRIAQIGTGHGHAGKLSVYRQSPDYEVIGIAEPDPMLKQRAQKQAAYRDLPWMEVDELLNQPGLQAVLVETQVRDLLNTAEKCIAAGKHIHLDKPAGTSFPQFDRLLTRARQQQLIVQLGYMYRYNPGALLIREFQKQGWLGEIFEVHAVMSKLADPALRQEMAEFSGGMMFELGCHLIDMIVTLLGAPEQVTPFLRHSSPIRDSLMDNCQAMLEYPRALASVVSSANEVDGGRRRHLVVCGTQATIQIQPLDNPGAVVTLLKPCGEYAAGTHTVKLPRFSRYIADAADMARIIRGEKENDFSYDHERNVQKTILQASAMPLT